MEILLLNKLKSYTLSWREKMQDRYFGDIGDFSKYGMLRIALNVGLKLGLNWYLYTDENHNNDGAHTGYLTNDIHRVAYCDQELYTFLKCKKTEWEKGVRRSVRMIEQSNQLVETVFYSNSIFHSVWIQRSEHRKAWHEESLRRLKDVDVVFCDPDNGLETPTFRVTHKKSGKYILFDEVTNQYSEGKSLIVYHHGPLWFRAGAMQPYVQSHISRIKASLTEPCTVACLRWETTAKRFYFWVIRPEHKNKMITCINALKSEPWCKHFKLISINESE